MNIRICIVIAVIVGGSTKGVFAQDSLERSTIAVSVGLSNVNNKDEFQSPYTYKGNILLLNATYSRTSAIGRHVIDFTYTGGQIKSVVSPEANTRLLFLYYDYLFSPRAKGLNEKIKLSSGIGIHTFLSSTNYLPEIESPKTYLSGGAYLTLTGNVFYQINKHNSITFQLGIPIVGVVHRPDFEINGKTLTKATFIGQSMLLSARLQYDYRITNSLTLKATYNCNYFTFDEPRQITILQNGLSFGLAKTF